MSDKAMKKNAAGSGSFVKKFIGKWQENPLYSTGAVLIVMIIIQTIALGFNFPSFGWGDPRSGFVLRFRQYRSIC